jgi:hypothetical protein
MKISKRNTELPTTNPPENMSDYILLLRNFLTMDKREIDTLNLINDSDQLTRNQLQKGK